MKKVTVIGGGTGTFVVLTALKESSINLGVIVTMMDSGGSTGRLRDQLGVLPPGDLRQCLVALSEAPLLWRSLFLYRFENGDLAGHNFGNIFISALEKVSANYDEVIDTASFVLKTKGKVIPVTFKKTHLGVTYENGNTVKGEGKIDTNVDETKRIIQAFLKPKVFANPKAMSRISQSDYLILGPGDLYTSIIPVLLVDGVKQAILKSNAKIIYIMNLMTKSGQTSNYKATDHLEDMEKYLGKKPDYVLVNNGKIPSGVLEWYLRYHENPVVNNIKDDEPGIKMIQENFTDQKSFIKSKSDQLTRSILRHDSTKLKKILVKIIL
jgi:uncharacterized cofD-like protein